MASDSILIVDDETSICETLGDILDLEGYKVRAAQTGEAAESIVRTERVDVALIDLRLPDRSGLDILRFIKDASPETEVLIISGFASLASAIEAMRYGAFGYVQKPVDVEEVLANLKRALERQRMARDLRQANIEIQDRLQELELLQETSRVVSSHLELSDVLQILAEQMVWRGQVTLCCISVLGPERDCLSVRAVFPARALPWELGQGNPIGLDLLPTHKHVVETKEVSILKRDNRISALPETEAALVIPEGVCSALLVPMVVKERVMGVVTLLEERNWERSPFTARKVSLCRAMASGAAIAIENALLFEERDRSHLATLAALASALDAREHETQAHSRRVQEYSLRLAREMGLPEADRRHLASAALLHDVGKIGISDGILLKTGDLTEDEWGQMRRHPVICDQILNGLPHLETERAIVIAHHEHWDGSGYPRGLIGTQIPLGARIFSIADALDAITSDRPYRMRKTFEAARREIAQCAGSQFDPEAVTAFLRIPVEEWEEIQRRASASPR